MLAIDHGNVNKELSQNEAYKEVVRILELIKQGKIQTMVPLLPLSLVLEGIPYTLNNHFTFETLFGLNMPKSCVFKCGRQTGKCRIRSCREMVYADNGRPLLPNELIPGQKVLSLNEDMKFESATITACHENGVAKVVKLKTRLGSEITLTPNHKLKTLYGYTEVKDLKVGSRIAAIKRGGCFNNIPQDYKRITLMAYMLGDGCCMKRCIRFTSASEEVLADYEQIITPILDIIPMKKRRKGGGEAYDCCPASKQLRKYLLEDELLNKYSHQKRCPPWVFDLSEKDTILFLSKLWATDGSINLTANGTPCIEYNTTSFDLGRDVRALLHKLSIYSSVKQCKAGYKDKRGIYRRYKDVYKIRVETREGWKSFMDRIVVPGKPPVPIKNVRSNNNRDTLPIEINYLIKEIVKKTKNKHKNSLRKNGLRVILRYPPTKAKIARYLNYLKQNHPDHPKYKQLQRIYSSDIVWDSVVSIKNANEQQTYDIEVEHTNNYVLDGIVSHNSQSIAAFGLMLCVARDNFKILYVTPLYEQIRRFSNNYVRPFIEQSTIKSLLLGNNSENSVLQRSFKNYSVMYFSYAFLDADRIRGIKSDTLFYDECQDLDRRFPPIINETMSYSQYELARYTGTPKTKDNTLEGLWQRSSQAEWSVPCKNCKYLNIPAMGYDLEKMIGPLRDDICEEKPAVICAKCRLPINPRYGRWVHKRPNIRHNFAGYHIPQIVVPLHYSKKEKWSALLAKQAGAGNTTTAMFYNEVLGESYDQSTKLISLTELQQAANLNPNEEPIARGIIGKYSFRVLGVDWGGGGEEGVSFTTMAVAGIKPDGRIDIIFGKKLLTPHDHLLEAKECLRVYNAFNCELLAHDYTGAGSLRETFLIHAGLDPARSMPVQYVRAASRNIINFVPATAQHPKNYYRMDKSRSLQLVCYGIKLGKIGLFKYDYRDDDNPGLLHDFLALIENKIPTAHAGDIYSIQKMEGFSDDFAHAVNMSCCALWHMTGSWPRFTDAVAPPLTSAQEQALGYGAEFHPWSKQ